MIGTIYTPTIADYVLPQQEEVEDPPEPFKTPEALMNERDPMHKLEERLDSAHMINHANWGIYFTTHEYLNYSIPFQEDIVQQEAISHPHEYDSGYFPVFYSPNSESEENNDTASYSITFTHQSDDMDILIWTDSEEIRETEEPLDININDVNVIIFNILLVLETEGIIQKLIEAGEE